jgi:glutamate racemase
MPMPQPTIGVFDSGFGGLTVLRALLPLAPGTHFLYLGDTARLPYGAKSQTTISRYAVESSRFLEDHGCDHLVIACNTATALALPDIRDHVGIAVTGVIEPGARAAAEALARVSPGDHAGESGAVPAILVLATAATVQSHAYRDTCAALGLRAYEKACPLLVPLVEEGWTDHPVLRDVLRIYLREALEEMRAVGLRAEAVLLGCTHYPLIADAIRQALRELGSDAEVVDSAAATARTVAATLPVAATTGPATFACYATDSVEKFARLGSVFLQRNIPEVHLLDLGG